MPGPEVILNGEAGFTPVFPKVGDAITYYWGESNIGDPHTEGYHARVMWKHGDTVIDDVFVDCTALGHNESAQRTTQLSAPTASGIDYSIELWVDTDHNQNTTTANYAYHAVTVDEAG